MAELTVLAGLPGSGKSELARALYPMAYVNSDYWLHDRWGGDFAAYEAWLIDHLERNRDRDVVVDDWYRNHARWHEQPACQSLHRLAAAIPHTVRVILMARPRGAAELAMAWKGHTAPVPIAELQANLMRKVEAFICG